MAFQRILAFRSDGAVYQGKNLEYAVLISDGWVELLEATSMFESNKENRVVAVLELSDPWVLENIPLPIDILKLIERRLEPVNESSFELPESVATASAYLQAKVFEALQSHFLMRSQSL